MAGIEVLSVKIQAKCKTQQILDMNTIQAETQMQYTSTRNVLPWNQRITSHTSYTDSRTYDSLFGRLKERENWILCNVLFDGIQNWLDIVVVVIIIWKYN